jgi:GNAT superfamily N-acetyltransferase
VTGDDVERASAWLGATGTDQWQYPVRVHAIRDEVAAGDSWVVRRDDGRLLATVTLEEDDHSDLWAPADHPDRALYVHHLVVDRSDRPADLGSAMLDWAARQAAKAGKAWLRLDAWTSNTGLHKYYLDRGFRQVLTVDEVRSGALFERPVTVQLGRGPILADPTAR